MRSPDEISIDDDDLTTAEAAELAGVTPETIRVWVHRGHLEQAPPGADGRPRYRALDVAKAEAKTRRHARR